MVTVQIVLTIKILHLILQTGDQETGNRTSALAQEAYDKRDQLKLTQIIHDGGDHGLLVKDRIHQVHMVVTQNTYT